jgi:hypothetical protein
LDLVEACSSPEREVVTKMSDENVTLDLLGSRRLGMTADVRDLQQRFDGLEARFSSLETRFASMEARFAGVERRLGVLEERMTRLIALVVRIAERQGVSE